MRKVGWIWALRAAFFVAAAGFIIYGVLDEQHKIVLMKAVMICLECIGLG
ncbi:MAG: CD1871A family CXXC motif-containing protein [Clostridia bacterium]|nr:CD1871A family CXXC motif-containing protein [Clostridia bacterium]